jgi:DNA polymerase-4
VTVKLRYADFRTLTRSRTGEGLVGDGGALAGTAVALVRGLFPLRIGVRLLGVTVSGFEEEGGGRGRAPAVAGQPAFDFDGAAPPAA